MAQPTLYDLMVAADPSTEAAALQNVLRKRAALGSLLAGTGDSALGSLGGGMVKSADEGQQQMATQAGQRLRMALEAQQHKQQQDYQQQQLGLHQQQLEEEKRSHRANESLRDTYNLSHSLAGRGTGSAQGGDDVEAIADAIASGQQPPELKGLYKYAAPVRAALAKRGFDMTTAQRDWGAVTRHVATLNGQQQERLRQAINFTEHQAGNIEKLYDEWQRVAPNSGFRIFNRAMLGMAKQKGGEAGAVAQALEAQIADLTSEMGNVYMGGNSPTDHSLKLAAENLSRDWDEPTFKKAIGLIKQNLALRRNAMLQSPVAGLSEGSVYAPKAPGAEPAASGAPRRRKYNPATGTLE